MMGTISETQDQRIALSIENASKSSGLSKPFLRLEFKRGKLKAVRPGNSRRVLIMVSDFLNYLNGEK